MDYNDAMDKMKKFLWFLLAVCPVLLVGCSSGAKDKTAAAALQAEFIPLLDLSVRGAAPDRAVWSAADRLDITAAGTYRLTGSLTGRVTVDADGPVTLVLENVALAGESCLNILSNDPVTLSAPAGTVNYLTDTDASASGEATDAAPASDEAEDTDDTAQTDASGAVITSKAPLRLTGGGIVRVTAAVNNGVRCKDALTVDGGMLTVVSANHGLKARGRLTVSGGQVSIRSGGDGLVAETARLGEGVVALAGGQVDIEAVGRGVDAEDRAELSGGALTVVSENDAVRADIVSVTGGTLDLTAACDGIQAATLLSVEDGTLRVVTGGGGGAASQHRGESFGPWGQQSAAQDTASAKGLKSDGDIAVTGGRIDLSTSDDGIHCGLLCTIGGGELTILSSDDAIHADDMLVIEGGTLDVTDCFEGLEAYAVEIRGGDTVIRAVNDGINANGPENGFGGWGVQTETFDSVSGSDVSYVRMAGGTVDLVVTGNTSNMGDGIDSNGAFYMEGGALTISTFGSYMENGIDTGSGGPVVTGGMVMAGGAATMQDGWSSASTQCCALIYTGSQPAGTTVVITDSDGGELWSVTLANTFNCLLLSHPGMTVGNTYTVSYGSGATTLDFTSATVVNSAAGGASGGMGGFGARPGFR